MYPPISPISIARSIPVLASAKQLTVTALADVVSLNNTNYRVDADGHLYLLRVPGAHGHHLGILRADEVACSLAAQAAGVGPDVHYSEPTGLQLLQFVNGRHWEPGDFRQERNLMRLGEALALLRTQPAVQGLVANGSVFERIRHLLYSAQKLGTTLPIETHECLKRLDGIERDSEREITRCARTALAHNDLWANNFLDDGSRIYIVDWEFAGLGDQMYDIATLALAGGLSDAESQFLLERSGLAARHSFDTLRNMQWVVSLFEGCWSLVMGQLKPADNESAAAFDYHRYSKQMFSRLV